MCAQPNPPDESGATPDPGATPGATGFSQCSPPNPGATGFSQCRGPNSPDESGATPNPGATPDPGATPGATGFSQCPVPELLAAPAVERAAESLARLVPGVCLWHAPPGGNRRPIRPGSDPHCPDFAGLAETARREILAGDGLPADLPAGELPWVTPCCPGRFRALFPLRFRSRDLGVVGVCGLGRESVRHAARVLMDTLRLLAALVEDHDNLELVHRLWDEMRTDAGAGPLLRECLDHVLAALGVTRGAIFLFDENGNPRLSGNRGLDPLKAAAAPLRYGLVELERFLRDRPAPPVPLPPDHPLRRWARAAAGDEPEPAELELVPLAHGGRPLGFVLLLGRPPAGPEDRPAFRVLLEGLGSAIKSALAFDTDRDRARTLATIHAVYRLAMDAESGPDFFHRLCRLLADTFRVEKCGLMLWNPDAGRLEPAAAFGLEPGEVGTSPVVPPDGLIGKAAATFEAQQIDRAHGDLAPGEPAAEGDASRYPAARAGDSGYPAARAGDSGYPARSYLSVPVVGEDLVAVLTFGTNTREFSPADRRMAFTLGEQIAVALRMLHPPASE